uniref:P2X purinoreceptor 7 intracellular domain-containing protein n=1 Tax=Cyprinus carpio carpio TaxID=630221 RepID=A0A8C1DJ89_CYPCA
MESNCSDASSFATKRSFEEEDFSPPPSPKVKDVEVSVDTGPGPEPHQLEPLAQTARMGPVSECDQIGWVGCVTAHPGFEPVALNPYVLQAVYGTYVQLYGEMEETVINSVYRHHAYRNVIRWCWGYLGQHIRVVIPSCAVTRIREEFPEEGPYRGFLPPLHF